MKTLKELRQACKVADIHVKKQTLSHGIHLKFSADGISTGAVNCNHQKVLALREIKDKFRGMTIDGQKVYGLS
jgi:hypothetical protein